MTRRLHPELRERSCKTNLKHAYTTRAIAMMRASQFAKRTGGRKLRAYKCPGCRMWHLTSQAER